MYKSKILLAQRPQHKHHGGLWEFPGGKIESGENTTEALARELNEELLLDISIDSMNCLGCVSTEKINLFLVAIHLPNLQKPQVTKPTPLLTTPALIPLEHSALAWTNFEGLSLFSLCPSDQKAILVFSKHIRSLFLESN